ncbi:MAG: hypothetical protein IT436_12500 [Phycisphaerales bacterium]|nr:hypothetical protein [Phycisphaerales bacterium]
MTRTRSTRPRAFALPLAVLLSVTATLMAAVMLDRVTAQTLTVQRTLEDYRATHQKRGMCEVVQFWLREVANGRRAADSLDPDGRALDLQLADGSVVSLFIADGQSTMLADLSALADADRQLAGQMLAQLRSQSPGLHDSERAFGPLAISANSAPHQVLQAAATAIAGADPGAAFANAVIEARAQKALSSQDLSELALKAEIEGEPRGRLLRAITAEPSMWKVLVDVRGAQNGPLLARAEMFAVAPARARGGSPFQRTSIFNFHWLTSQEAASASPLVTPP